MRLSQHRGAELEADVTGRRALLQVLVDEQEELGRLRNRRKSPGNPTVGGSATVDPSETESEAESDPDEAAYGTS